MGEMLQLHDLWPLRLDLNISESSKAGVRTQNRYFFLKLCMGCCPGLRREPVKFVLGADGAFVLLGPADRPLGHADVPQVPIHCLGEALTPCTDAVSCAGSRSV